MKNIIYIFGAGASKDFGLPLGNEIFDRAYKILKNNKDVIIENEFKALLIEVEKNMKKYFTNLPNDKRNYPYFEEVMTLIWNRMSNDLFDIIHYNRVYTE